MAGPAPSCHQTVGARHWPSKPLAPHHLSSYKPKPCKPGLSPLTMLVTVKSSISGPGDRPGQVSPPGRCRPGSRRPEARWPGRPRAVQGLCLTAGNPVAHSRPPDLRGHWGPVSPQEALGASPTCTHLPVGAALTLAPPRPSPQVCSPEPASWRMPGGPWAPTDVISGPPTRN